MKFILLLISILVQVNCYSQLGTLLNTDIDFAEKKADSITIKADSILLVGIGSSSTRAFLNDLGDELMKEFNSYNIHSEYRHLGKDAAEARSNFKEINKTGYKAMLVILPLDTAAMTVYNSTVTTAASGNASISLPPRTHFRQTFDIQFSLLGASTQKVWNAIVTVDCDPSEKYGSRRAAGKLIYGFKKRKYIE